MRLIIFAVFLIQCMDSLSSVPDFEVRALHSLYIATNGNSWTFDEEDGIPFLVLGFRQKFQEEIRHRVAAAVADLLDLLMDVSRDIHPDIRIPEQFLAFHRQFDVRTEPTDGPDGR